MYKKVIMKARNGMKQYDYILFDLDGTITDPGIGITNSVIYALKKYGINVADRTQLYKFIGPPLLDSFEKFYGFSKEESKKAVDYYREYYAEKGIFEADVYEGLEELLQKLLAIGKTLIVATSKPELFAVQVLKHYGLDHYFTYIAGSNFDETRTNKAEVITYALETCNITDKEKIVMVGDREHDMIGATTVGIDAIGVLFGYGSREELENAGATYIAENVEDIYKFIHN
jgi:phosphoglycolate phosphatase